MDKETLRTKYSKEYQEGFDAYKNDRESSNPYLGQAYDTEQLLAWAYGVEDARGHIFIRLSRWFFFHGVPISIMVGLLAYLKMGNELQGFFKVIIEAWSYLTLNTGALIGFLLGIVIILAPAYFVWYFLLRLIGIKYRRWI